MTRAEKLLREWTAQGLVSSDQAAKIRAYESTKPESSWILSGLLFLGVATIGIGVISLIAANWALIPPWAKLTSNFTLLGVVAVATHAAWTRSKPVVFEALLLFFMLQCLASIGLISQIYNTGGRFDQALLFWSVITAGAMVAARRSLVPFLWLTALYTGLAGWAVNSRVHTMFGEMYPAIFAALFALFALFTFLSLALGGVDTALSRALRAGVLLAGLASLVTSEMFVDLKVHLSDLPKAAFVPVYGLGALTLLALWGNGVYRTFQKALLAGAFVLVIVAAHFCEWGIHSQVLFAITTIVILLLTAIFLASEQRRGWFQAFLFLLGVRFLVLYFQALGGLATTGVGLIASGALILAMTWSWNVYRKPLVEWVERWSS